MDLSGTGKAASAPTGTGRGSALQRRLSVERQHTSNPFAILLGPSRLVFRNTSSQLLLDVYYTHRTRAFHLCIGRDFPVLACEGLVRSARKRIPSTSVRIAGVTRSGAKSSLSLSGSGPVMLGAGVCCGGAVVMLVPLSYPPEGGGSGSGCPVTGMRVFSGGFRRSALPGLPYASSSLWLECRLVI